MAPLEMANVLSVINLFLSSANVIIVFALLVYILTHDPRHPVTVSFCILMGFLNVVYLGDITHISTTSLGTALLWLRVQWLGVAFVPAAYLHFSDALLRSTGSLSRRRRWAVVAACLASTIFFLVGLFTDALVERAVTVAWGTHFIARPLYAVFAAYFLAVIAGSTWNLWRARRRCLTRTARRRMTYLFSAFIPAVVGAVPYLLVTYFLDRLPPAVLVLFPIAGNAGIAIMAVVMAYSVAYHGVLAPDRVVKQSLIQYLLRGPFLAICLVGMILIVPRLGRLFGLQVDKVLIVAMVFIIIVLQVLLDRLKPYLDRLVYQHDQEEIGWLEEIDQRLITTSDLEQLLENTLAAICETLRVHTGFIVAPDGEGAEFRLRASCGSQEAIATFLASHELPALIAAANAAVPGPEPPAMVHQNGYWLVPLRSEAPSCPPLREVRHDGASSEAQQAPLGFLCIESTPDSRFTPEHRRLLHVLVTNLELALEDMQLQRRVFTALRHIGPEIELVQQWSRQLKYASPESLQQLETNPIFTPDFQRLVKEALAHYWGGPKLTRSPLLNLEVVKAAAQGNRTPVQALRAVMAQAVEALRPEGERDRTSTAWLLYDLLTLKFLRGKRVREAALELAVSESDFYRKERAAIEEVAKILEAMEREKLALQEEREKPKAQVEC
jgi:hypothetical protein